MNVKQDNPQPTDPRRGARREPAWPETVERRIGLDLNGGVMRMADSTDSSSEESIDRSLPAGVLLPSHQTSARQLRRQLISSRGRLRRSTLARRQRDRSPHRPVRPI